MIPTGRTVREQLEAWRDSQPEENRESALRLAGLRDLYATILSDGELSKAVQYSIQSPRIRKKLEAVGIDMDTTWVDMAKKAVDPTRDWFPDVTTRQNVVTLFRPYFEAIGGGDQLGRLFFDGKDIDSIFVKAPNKSLPGFVSIVAIMKFCIEDVRAGGERLKWTSAQLTFMEAQWNVFGRGNLPLPELVDEATFNDWFCRCVPHERVDHIAKSLNDALGSEEFKSALLIRWRKGNLPSREKLEALLRGIKIAFPEWLSFQGLSQETTESPVEPPVVTRREEPPATPTPAPEPPSVSAVLAQILGALQPLIPELAAAEQALLAKVEAARRTPAHTEPAPARKATQDPGEVVNGLRFVLTASSFKREEVFNLDEVEETENLISELTRRLAQMNSMKPGDKRAVLRRLKHAFDELFVQVRHMDAQREDLPALFLEMRITAAALTGKGLDEIG